MSGTTKSATGSIEGVLAAAAHSLREEPPELIRNADERHKTRSFAELVDGVRSTSAALMLAIDAVVVRLMAMEPEAAKSELASFLKAMTPRERLNLIDVLNDLSSGVAEIAFVNALTNWLNATNG